ncbi:hypothetical protein GCM10023238_32350 [Streptomyces heliomycini]
MHTCALTYASDMTLLDAVRIPVEPLWVAAWLDMASLDHAMWFHRPFRADEWFLYDRSRRSPRAGGAWPAAVSTTWRAGCWCPSSRKGCSGLCRSPFPRHHGRQAAGRPADRLDGFRLRRSGPGRRGAGRGAGRCARASSASPVRSARSRATSSGS